LSTTDLPGQALGSSEVQASDFRVEAAPYPLLFHILAAEGQDPILLGATGYADTVFTSRLVSDSE
jgi:hypothetical protein